MTVTDNAGRWLPPRLNARLSPFVRRVDAILSGSDSEARAERMALTAFLIRVASAGIAFLSQILLARLMGSYEYGIFVFVWALAVIFGNLSCFGFHTAVIRFLPGYRDEGAYAEIHGLARTARRFAVTSATLVAATGILVLQFFGEAIDAHYLVPLAVGLFILPVIALGDVLDGTAQANNWPVLGLGATFLLRPTLIIAMMGLAILAGFPADAVTALSAALAATWATTAIQYLAVTVTLKKRYAARATTVTFRRWFAVALPIFFVEGFYFLLTNADVIVVGFFVPPDQVAVYFAAAKTMALVHFVHYAVKAGASPRFAELVSGGRRSELARFAAQTVGWTFWPALAVGGAVLLVGPFLLSLFGPGFAEGHMLMAILFAGILAKAAIGPGEVLLTMAGDEKICAFVYLGVLAANVALGIWLIPLHGLEGAAMATAGAMVIEAVALHIVVRHRLAIAMFFLARPSGGEA